MQKYFLLVFSMTACLLYDTLKKAFSKKSNGKIVYQYLFCACAGIVAFTVCALFGLKKVSYFTLYLAICYGIITFAQLFCTLKALECGPVSYTFIIGSLSTVIPTLSGTIFWHETISVFQIVGIVLMAISIVLSTLKDNGDKKAQKKWFIYCSVMFLTTGPIGVIQKWHQNTVHAGESNGFLAIAFACLSVIATVFSVVALRKNKVKINRNKTTVIFAFMFVICGICAAFNNKINLYLSGKINSAILFPVLNGGGAVLITLVSLLVFKERLTIKQWIGIIIGITAIVLLCI